MSTKVRSLTESAYNTLRADLTACRLPPGRRLKIQELCTRLNVGPSAVREALSRLSAEGLVVAEAQKGFQVAPVSIEDLNDLTRTRISIETMCLQRAIAVGRIDWESGIVAAYHRLSRTPEHAAPGDHTASDEWAAAHSAFHLALMAACDSAWLLRIRAMLYQQSERYRRLSVSASRVERDIDSEHRAVMDATLARDAKQACTLLTDHLSTTARLVRSLSQDDGENEPVAVRPMRRGR